MSLVSRDHTFQDWSLLGNQREMKVPESPVREPGLHPVTEWANTPHFRSLGDLLKTGISEPYFRVSNQEIYRLFLTASSSDSFLYKCF